MKRRSSFATRLAKGIVSFVKNIGKTIVKAFTGFEKAYAKATNYKFYSVLVYLLGIPVTLIVFLSKVTDKTKSRKLQIKNEIEQSLGADYLPNLVLTTAEDIKRKNEYFGITESEQVIKAKAEKSAKAEYNELVETRLKEEMAKQSVQGTRMGEVFGRLYRTHVWFRALTVLWLPLLLILVIFKNPFLKYAFERLLMLVFVIFGVTFVVFTILYLSPSDPAKNVLGVTATPDEIFEWRQVRGLNDPYIVQLLRTFKNLVTFNMGKSFTDVEIIPDILGKFPITLKVTIWSLLVAVTIAIPAGIISAIKQYSKFDFAAMTSALIGLSIPNFWLGFMLILVFSINLQWVPSLYDDNNWLTMIMPAFVIGTGLAASVARMTRSSMLDVSKADYITTARAKGVKERTVVLKHALKNAIIPIITIVGLQFGGMLGGSAVTERVFNIKGLGDFIVSAQMYPDIPVVIAGVVYVAIVISCINLFVDLLYAVFDPRIKARISRY